MCGFCQMDLYAPDDVEFEERQEAMERDYVEQLIAERALPSFDEVIEAREFVRWSL